MSVELISFLTFFLFLLALYQFFTKNDEFLFLPVIFFAATGIMRYNAVLAGTSKWAVVAYAQNIFDLNNELASTAINLFFLGTAIFTITYFLKRQSVNFFQQNKLDKQKLLIEFVHHNQLFIIGLLIFFVILNMFISRRLEGAVGLAYGMSYFFLFKMAIGGLILLMFLVFKYIPLTNLPYKIFYAVLIAISAYASYNSTSRFQFLSWMVALGLMIVKDMLPTKKIKYYLIGGFVIIIAFMMAGNQRHSFIRDADFKSKIDWAFRRIELAEDQNMLDGFMMVLQVYPKHLDYHLGGEHLEILLRPIPRKVWPEKPVGGYANKLKLNDLMPQSITVGISQSIYGTFYGEGGVMGILIFSILYGLFFVWLLRFSYRYTSDLRYLIKGIIYASLIPLLRGGDLPGIVAFIGMSYWPVFLFIYRYNNFLKTHKESINEEVIIKKPEIIRKTKISIPI